MKPSFDKCELKKMLHQEYINHLGDTSLKHRISLWISQDSSWLRWKYVYHMRKSVFYQRNIFLHYYHERKKNIIGNRLGFEIGGENIKEGLILFHNGPIVINGNSIIGENCRFHGDNCVGNDGVSDDCPVIGNNVDIGVGAKIIGGVYIADNCTIGAGAVVVNSFTTPGMVIVGVPAKGISKKEE